MTNYYFLASLLSPLSLRQKPELSLSYLGRLLNTSLKPADLKKLNSLRQLIDIYNLRSFWLGNPIDRRGNLSEDELEAALVTHSGLPAYVLDFISKYPNNEQRIRQFPLLIHQYYEKEIDQSKGFVKKYLQFERDLRLVMVGFRAKELGKDVSEELQYEDPFDLIVAQILAQKDAPVYDPPEGYENLKTILIDRYHTPLELHEALSEYRINKIEEMLEGELFSIDRILGYVLQLIIVEQWQELMTREGLKIVDAIVKDAK